MVQPGDLPVHLSQVQQNQQSLINYMQYEQNQASFRAHNAYYKPQQFRM